MILVSFFHISTEWGRSDLRTNSEKSKKVKKAWQAQISSHALATFRKNWFLKDIWMVLLSFFDIFNTCPTITSICSTGTYWPPCMSTYCSVLFSIFTVNTPIITAVIIVFNPLFCFEGGYNSREVTIIKLKFSVMRIWCQMDFFSQIR